MRISILFTSALIRALVHITLMGLNAEDHESEMQREPEKWTEGENIGSAKSNRPGLNHESAMFNWVCGFRQSPTLPKACLSHPRMGLHENVLQWNCTRKSLSMMLGK